MNDLTTLFPTDKAATSAGWLDADVVRVSPEIQGAAGWVVFPDILQDRVQIGTVSTTGSSTAFSYITNEQTVDRIFINREMALLEAVAKIGNPQIFIALLNSLTWANRPADDYVRAVRLCLAIGLHQKARQLAMEGANQFPNNPDLQRLAQLLGPARVIRSDVPPDVNATANMEWLRQHSDEYRGQYVAVKGGELLATASSYQDLFQKVGPVKGTGVLVTQVF